MKTILIKKIVTTVAICSFTLFSGCSRAADDTKPGDAEKGRPAIKWPPRAGRNDKAAIEIIKGDEVSVEVPKEDPIHQEGKMSIDSSGNLMPKRGVFKITGGTLVTKVHGIRKEAKFNDWDYIYGDTNRSKILTWGSTLTSGELLLPKSMFINAPAEAYAQNFFQCEDFGEHFVLVKLDPNKGHRLCVIGQYTPTIGLIGSRADVDGTVVTLKPDGWYDGKTLIYATERK